jgi:hypothetical protein
MECPCCGAAPDTEIPIPLTRTPDHRIAAESARELAFPYCKRCVAHVAAWEQAAAVPAAMLLIGIIVAVILGIAVHFVAGVITLAIAGPAAWFVFRARRTAAKAALGPSCASPSRALDYLGWSGAESSFELESHAYAAKLAEQNQSLLAHPSVQLTRLLEGHRVARLAVPTPAAAIHTVPPPATVKDWIGRIESAAGAVARRTTLQRALDGLHEQRDRQEVLASAVAFEVAPFLDEVEGMSSIAAKGRLQRAIDMVRADNMPEELQTSVLRELDTRWRRLGYPDRK